MPARTIRLYVEGGMEGAGKGGEALDGPGSRHLQSRRRDRGGSARSLSAVTRDARVWIVCT
jgi:hypothetical protein